MDAAELKRILESAAGEMGFSHFGWTRFERPFSFDIYRRWIADGLHGEMDYLEKHLPLKEEPARFSSTARSVLVFAFPYRPHPEPAGFPLKAARVAAYAKGGDYHFWMKDRLRAVGALLAERWPSLSLEVHTDSSPLPERDLAARAGLGWIGRNGCVIHPKQGSFFLLGEILLDAEITETPFAPLPDFCGTCRRCIEACPTDALLESRVMDARKCLSYLSIESRALPSPELRSRWGDWLFGCDICQSVCPWNAKPFQPATAEGAAVLPHSAVDDDALVAELRWLLTSSGKQLEKAFHGSALSRAGSFGLKRNAMMVAVSRGYSQLRGEIEALREHPKLQELADWALAELERPRSNG